ncbi:MAG: hypothetical protein ACK4RZ_17025 [Paracoccaceae bacterium]
MLSKIRNFFLLIVWASFAVLLTTLATIFAVSLFFSATVLAFVLGGQMRNRPTQVPRDVQRNGVIEGKWTVIDRKNQASCAKDLR